MPALEGGAAIEARGIRRRRRGEDLVGRQPGASIRASSSASAPPGPGTRTRARSGRRRRRSDGRASSKAEPRRPPEMAFARRSMGTGRRPRARPRATKRVRGAHSMLTVPEVVPSVGDARAPEGRGRAGGGTGSPLVQRGGRAAGRGRCRRGRQPQAPFEGASWGCFPSLCRAAESNLNQSLVERVIRSSRRYKNMTKPA